MGTLTKTSVTEDLVGKDIEAICGKCGDVWHVVVAVARNKIAKVSCKQCRSEHRYQSSDGAHLAPKVKRPRRAAVKKAEPVRVDPNRPIRDYTFEQAFQSGEQIRHAKFGTGVVTEIVGPKKIRVQFEASSVILVQSSTGIG